LTDDALQGRLSRLLRRPVVIIGVGNEMRGDDAFGPRVAAELSRAGSLEGVEVLDGGVAPENIAERAVRTGPASALIVDTAGFGGAVGELRLLAAEELGWASTGTHAPSLGLLASYIAQRCGARVAVLAAQPGTTGLGARMSPKVTEAARRAASAVRRALEP